jgi:hypothetical protein
MATASQFSQKMDPDDQHIPASSHRYILEISHRPKQYDHGESWQTRTQHWSLWPRNHSSLEKNSLWVGGDWKMRQMLQVKLGVKPVSGSQYGENGKRILNLLFCTGAMSQGPDRSLSYWAKSPSQTSPSIKKILVFWRGLLLFVLGYFCSLLHSHLVFCFLPSFFCIHYMWVITLTFFLKKKNSFY